jgi:photosystem II stability/assembly factor-like uncharacterized protein
MSISIAFLASPLRARSCAFAGLVGVVTACSSGSTPAPAPSDGAAPPPAAWMAAVGTLGTFAQTLDGSTWTTRSIVAQDLYTVTCVGNLDGWAAGAGGTVAHTVDGGWAWTLQNAHTTADVRAIRFGSATLGLLAGDAGVLEVTQDGGATWSPVGLLTASALHGVAVAATAGVMLAVGDAGVVLRSGDSGATWTAAAVPGAGDLQGIAMDGAARLVLAVDASGGAWSSTDAGQTFVREATASVALAAVALADDDSAAIAVGSGGTVLERAASGAWATVPTGTTANLRAAVIGDDGRQYAGGDSGTLVSSATGGASWTPVSLATDATLYALDDL